MEGEERCGWKREGKQRMEAGGKQRAWGSRSGSTTEKCVTSEEQTLRTSSWPGHIMIVLESETAAIEWSAVRCAEHCHRWCAVCARGAGAGGRRGG